ncbi:MAG: class I SAM-dependent methyltransferase [Hyphomicrobiales bacterium]|nr:class I SAM-dependent methyltransferase [Hyphomicrobiales bacterium]
MMTEGSAKKAHWEGVYGGKADTEVSWFEDTPRVSLDLIAASGLSPRSSVIHIGRGASRLVDALLDQSFTDGTVLDLSEKAFAVAKSRIGAKASLVSWVAADVTEWKPAREYDLWHDRAAFHFLTNPADRTAYLGRLGTALKPGGIAIIGAFAMNGPESCSGLPIVRYDATSLADVLGSAFDLIITRDHNHSTPAGKIQCFQFCVFQRRMPGAM